MLDGNFAGDGVLLLAADVELRHWLAFGGLVLVLLFADLALFHRHSTEPTLREAARGTLLWCLIALAFNGLMWYWRGPQMAVQFLTGYLLEWSLSMDNVFVFAVLFAHFKVPLKYQYRVLFWGILGAVLMRLTFILAGTELLQHFDWILPLFGVLLIFQGVKLAWQSESDLDPDSTLRHAAGPAAAADRPRGSRSAVFCPRGGALDDRPLVPGAAGDRVDRRGVCRRQRAGDSGHHHRSASSSLRPTSLRSWDCGLFIFCWPAPWTCFAI